MIYLVLNKVKLKAIADHKKFSTKKTVEVVFDNIDREGSYLVTTVQSNL